MFQNTDNSGSQEHFDWSSSHCLIYFIRMLRAVIDLGGVIAAGVSDGVAVAEVVTEGGPVVVLG